MSNTTKKRRTTQTARRTIEARAARRETALAGARYALPAAVALLLAISVPSAGQSPDERGSRADENARTSPDPTQVAEGARLYSETCGRCHNLRSPTERTDREWRTIMLHMRTRANLSASDTEAILAFLAATNLPEKTARPERSSARASPRQPPPPPETILLEWEGVPTSDVSLPSEARDWLVTYVRKLRRADGDPGS